MTTLSAFESFHPVDTPLKSGINLIEASAGTGKTYAIAMLVLRFVVEQAIDIRALLVVTFTKAATEELKTRIRGRLIEARRVLNNPKIKADANLKSYLNVLTLDKSLVKQRLDHAIQQIDQIGVFTIHGFCQRVLAEHALESGQLFNLELLTDIAAIKQACADDFWRKQLYERLAWQVSLVLKDFATPDELLKTIPVNISAQIIYPPIEDLDSLFNAVAEQLTLVPELLSATIETLSCAFADGLFKDSFVSEIEFSKNTWLNFDIENSIPDFSLLTEKSLIAGLNGKKFLKSKAKPDAPEQQKSNYIASLKLNLEPFTQLSQLTAKIRLMFRRLLLEAQITGVAKILREQHALAMDELISGLANALQGNNGELLRGILQQRFAAALIDEFQDTDLQQWQIFSSVFATGQHYLYLIGDPKQAIYKFRGADIFSYFAAQAKADCQQTLGKNWRSHPDLVQAVNQLFARPQALLFEQLPFHSVGAALPVSAGQLLENGEPVAPLQWWQLDKNEGNLEYWTAGKAGESIRAAIVREIVALLNGDAALLKDGQVEKLKPADVAILVRNNNQALSYQQSLGAVGIPAVINSKQSVFATAEAAQLYTLLLAVTQPGDIGLIKQALALSWFGFDGQAFYRLTQNEAELDRWAARFYDYQQYWLEHGLLAMGKCWLQQDGLQATIAAQANAERVLTNLNHLLERIEQAVQDEHLAMHKTLDWLQQAIHHAENASGDDVQLRLESDGQAVKIVTMHSSKGLEYPLVFCPCLWERNGRLATEKEQIVCHEDGQMVADLGSADFERRREQALQEELAEDLRLLYVAVTRAKFRCDIFWADVRTKDKPNNSALAYLMAFAEDDFAAQQQKFKALAADNPALFGYRLLTTEAQPVEVYRPAATTSQALSGRQRRRSLHSHWQMSSYSALSAHSLSEATELPLSKAEEKPAANDDLAETPEALWVDLPKGAALGNVLHALLESASFARLAAGEDISALRDRTLAYYGVRVELPERIDEWLQTIVSTPLSAEDGGFCLKNLAERDCAKEMPFYLAMKSLNVSEINAVLADCPSFQPLSAKAMSGFLTGFIDLVCCYQGRYYVMDYKSNTLPDYQAGNLIAAMREHNYGLQYWLYSVVLDRYLMQRLPDYDFNRHFGGVKYLFLRGMSQTQPAQAVFSDCPAFETISQLSSVFF